MRTLKLADMFNCCLENTMERCSTIHRKIFVSKVEILRIIIDFSSKKNTERNLSWTQLCSRLIFLSRALQGNSLREIQGEGRISKMMHTQTCDTQQHTQYTATPRNNDAPQCSMSKLASLFCSPFSNMAMQSARAIARMKTSKVL